jgi:diguanylate cyclase (GGDEF)-like protein
MLTNLSLKIKIFSLVTAVVVVSFLTVTWVVSDKSIKMAKTDAFNLVEETAEKYKNEIKAELQSARITAETLATVFETLKDHNVTDRKVMNDILKSALEKKDYITAFCIAYEPDALDGKDKHYAGQQPAYDKTGRYAPYWNKLEGAIAVEPLYDIDIADWYSVPKETKQEYITDPYPYHVQGHTVMLASLIFPVIHKEEFIGIISSDIVLDKLQELVSRENHSDMDGRTTIFSNSGLIVAHPDKSRLGKNIAELLLHETIVSDPANRQAAARRAARYLENRPAAQAPGAVQGDAGAAAEKFARHLEAYAKNPGAVMPDMSLSVPEMAEEILKENPRTNASAAAIQEAVRLGKRYVVADDAFYTVYMPIRFSSATKPWSVAVSIPMNEVLKNADDMRAYVLIISLIAVCAVSCLLYCIAASVAKPILVLADAATALGKGNFDIDVPLSQREDEIGALSKAFRFMAAKNRELIGKMQDYATELEEKNKHLNIVNKLKDEFLANTSHELRTPLNGIIGIVESMVDGATGQLSQEQKYNLSLVAGSGKRLSNMINDILDFAKLKNKELVLQIRPIDLKIAVDTVLALSKHLIPGKNLELICDIDGSLPTVDADENRIQQILYNLVGNAIKFTEKGSVRVSVEIVDGMAAVSVSDTGIGIPQDKFDVIFESFEQIDGSTEREYLGTGLGLSISKKLVELHGGAISVKSVLGAGSTFTFTLPLSRGGEDGACADPQATPLIMEDFSEYESAREQEQTAPRDGVTHTLLVVDDEPVNIRVLINILQLHSYCVCSASSGIEALNRINAGEKFDLILLDVMMPRMSGYDVCRKLRENYSLFNLPILMLTAKNQIQDLVLGLQAGANDYVQKPFDKVELLARVKTLLSLKDAVSDAIRNEKQFENEKQKRILEHTLLEVTKAITSTLHLKGVLQKILEAMSQFILFDKALVLLQEEERFMIRMIQGFQTDTLQEDQEVDVSRDVFLNAVMRADKPVVGNFPESLFACDRCAEEDLIGIPIVYRDKLLGIIVIHCKNKEISNELLFSLAGQAGVAIQNARLFTKINELATTDGLTGLNNRRHFFELAETEFTKYKRYGHALSVCMIDIDFFKRINDTYGHSAGDEVLKHLARTMSGLVREYDIIGRYGGEEFAILLPETPVETAAAIAERIREKIEKTPVAITDGPEITYTLSIGVSAFVPEITSLSMVFEAADKGLYTAKETGRNRVIVKKIGE